MPHRGQASNKAHALVQESGSVHALRSRCRRTLPPPCTARRARASARWAQVMVSYMQDICGTQERGCRCAGSGAGDAAPGRPSLGREVLVIEGAQGGALGTAQCFGAAARRFAQAPQIARRFPQSWEAAELQRCDRCRSQVFTCREVGTRALVLRVLYGGSYEEESLRLLFDAAQITSMISIMSSVWQCVRRCWWVCVLL